MSAARPAGTAATAVKLPLGLAAPGAKATAALRWLGLARTCVRADIAALAVRSCRPRAGVGFAEGFRPIRRTRAVGALLVAALAIAVLGRRAMTGRAVRTARMTVTVVALLTVLAVGTAVGLGRVAMAALRNLRLGRRLEPLQRLGRLEETFR